MPQKRNELNGEERKVMGEELKRLRKLAKQREHEEIERKKIEE